MRPNLLTVPQNESQSFDLRHEVVPYFTNPWHFHPELELNYVVQSSGTRFIGQSVERFEGGEIILIGKNLPHYWKNDAAFYHSQRLCLAEAIVVRFSEDFAGKDFFHLPETRAIQALFERAIFGLKLVDPLLTHIKKSMVELAQQQGFNQLLTLLSILQEIAVSSATEIISPHYVPSQLQIKHNDRLSKIFAYLIDHFNDPIQLSEVASVANMNEAALCRYFKSQTGQTITQYITDLRIRYACELLIKGEDSITQVCFQVGFENVSHFIQTFKKLRNQTPFEFRKRGKSF